MKHFELYQVLLLWYTITFLSVNGLPALINKGSPYEKGIKLWTHPLLLSLRSYHLLTPYQINGADKGKLRRVKNLSTELPEVNGIHKRRTSFAIEFENTTYLLNITLNDKLLAVSYSTSSYFEEDILVTENPIDQNKDHCYYQGHVEGITESNVVLTTCKGLRGWIMLPDDLLIIEPLFGDGSDAPKNLHVIYRPNDVELQLNVSSCGNGGLQENVESLTEKMVHRRSKRQADPNDIKYVELMMVADSHEARKFSRPGELEGRVKELLNYVDALYHKLGMRIVLSHLEVWHNADRVKFSSKNAPEVLDTFLSFRESKLRSEPTSSPWVYADNVHLLYGRNFNGSTAGIASSKSMCSSRSGGVSQDTFDNVLTTAAIVAHEIGHNFGLNHDGDQCSCTASSGHCVMAASSSFDPATDWSSCSHAYLEQNFKFGLQSCLLNVPVTSRIHFVGVCGNDIVEEGEECDCGHTYDCTSPCCNASSCTLVPGAQCDAGICCADCQFKPSGSVCRSPESNECDLEETCTGDSAFCPGNSYIEDGSSCANNTAFCAQGICLTFDLQCQSVWGNDSVNSNELCYNYLNRRGDEVGNCGYNQTQEHFISCDIEHTVCGKLQCSGGMPRPIIYTDRVAYASRLSGGGGEQTFTCKTIQSTSGVSDVLYQGLVKDGTKCAEDKVCAQGRCTSLRGSTCPFQCNGHGHCTNDGHCHCDAGWEQPYCAIRGITTAKCGNDVVDNGEECDCGHVDECKSKCCNATTCRLLPGAVCDGGECCSECRYLNTTNICRSRKGNVCDFSEYCTGKAAECPEDVHNQDGTLCDNGEAMCFQGICLTRDLQCQEMWGGSAMSSPDLCYVVLNERGLIDGNCGVNDEGDFIPCTKENVLCGSLHCQSGAVQPILKGIQFVYRSSIATRIERMQCKSVASNTLLPDKSLVSIVKDGTKCGSGKICVKGVCKETNNQANYTSSFGLPCNCNGHGHCDNHGHCHCDRGWATPDCSYRGSGVPECGNHIVEEGEECDCGHQGACERECCDPTTCRLVSGVVCDEGDCCDRCQYSLAGTICRETRKNECDLPEYCTGYSSKCPEDVFIENGTPCTGKRTERNKVLVPKSSFCYDGVCRKRDLQCEQIWGQNASSSEDVCYIYVNSVGNMNGNCGWKRGGGFAKCPRRHSLCGKLQCQGGIRKPKVQMRAFVNRMTYGSKQIICKTIASPKKGSSSQNDLGLVEDGTACAPGKMCYRGKCKIIPPLICSSKCSDHGVCNHLGHCHCDRGWAPPHCNSPGSGGSVDSETIVS